MFSKHQQLMLKIFSVSGFEIITMKIDSPQFTFSMNFLLA